MSASIPTAKNEGTTAPTDDVYEVTVKHGNEELRILIPGNQAEYFRGDRDPWCAALWLAYADRWENS